jgi:hypothetical protein
MSVTTAPQRHAPAAGTRPRSAVAALGALAVGAAWGIAFTIVALGFRLTPDDHPFRHAADYWYTGLGLPLVLSALTIVVAVGSLQAGRLGRRARWGTALFVGPMLIFSAMFLQALAQGRTSSWGPTYILCVLLSDIALALFVSGCWRAGALPRWLLATWWLGWFLGGPLAQGPTPLLLTVAYLLIAGHLARTPASTTSSTE